MAARGFLGAGDLYFNRIVSGVKQGMQGPFEAQEFAVKPNISRKQLSSRGRSTYGQVIESVNLAEPGDFTVKLPEVNKDSLALALLGSQAALAQGTGTLTAEVIPTVVLDTWNTLSKQNITTVTSVTGNSGTPTYVEGTDYVLNKRLGMIKFLSTGAVVAGDSPKINAAYGTTAGTRILGGTVTDIRAEFLLDGVNQADGLPCIVRVFEGIIAAQDAFDFLADDFAVVSLGGTMKTPIGGTAPFQVDLRSA